ncbi:hypothetical protein [Sphingomonas oryzagri]
MRSQFGSVAFFTTAAIILAGRASSMPPAFQDIESAYAGDQARDAGRAAILQAVPIGTSLENAEAVLRDAGARCKPRHGEPGAIRCSYNEMSNDGDAIDDTRWTTILHVQDGHVVNVTVDREVDTRVTS